MSERFTRVLRTVILRTNSHWPFQRINRLPYAAAMRTFVRNCRIEPEIRSVYLRHGLVESKWIPALSDIDFSLILRRGLPIEAEYKLVRAFWRRYRRLQRLFPMLGEVEILSEDELAPWLAASCCLPTARSWTLLDGEHNASLSADGSQHWRRRALSVALWIYLELLPACLAAPDSFLRRQDAGRRVRKILRLLQPVLAEAGLPPFPGKDSLDLVDLMTEAPFAFWSAVRHLDSAAAESRAAREPQTRCPAASEGCQFLPTSAPGLEGLRSILVRPDRTAIFVIEDDLERRWVRSIVRQCLQGWPGMRETPVLLPRSVFAYLVRHQNPFYYSTLKRSRLVAFGEDPLAGVDPPDMEACIGQALDRIANVLTFTRSEELMAETEPLRLPVLLTSLNRALTAKSLLRGDGISADAAENAALGRAAFPEAVRAFEVIEGQLAGGREEAARYAAFCLFRSLAGDIADQVARTNRGGVATAAAARPAGGG